MSNPETGPIATRCLPPDTAGIAEAAALLRAGELVAFPTETVYGLGADAEDSAAVARLYAAKGRPSFNPLIAHVADPEAAQRLGIFNDSAQTLAAAFWPGPLTMVVPVAADCPVSELARAGLPTVGLRVPSDPLAQKLLAAVGRPVVAPSANRSGHVSATDAAHVLADLDGRIAAVLDGGPTPIGVESTIVDCTGAEPALLREGGVTREAIEAVLGRKLASADGDDSARPVSPGRLASHYAPASGVRLDATEIFPGEALLAFGPTLPPGAESARAIINLSESGDLVEAAVNLFAGLRALDAAAPGGIAVMTIPPEGLGAAIRDRLGRAAAPRG